MKKGLIVLIAVVAVIGILVGIFAGSYNGFVDAEEALSTKAANLEIQLQRRADLIPKFVEAVKGYADYEQSTLTAVTEARSKLQSADAKLQSANGLAETNEAANEFGSAFNVWVNAVTEAYPELKTSEQFRGFQDELAGTENRIATARKDYNEQVEVYNKKVRRFPGSILASIFGFERAEKFEAAEGSETAPVVDFS